MELVERYTHEHFEVRGMSDIYEKYAWTVFEDPARLDGASLEETSKRFAY